MTTKRIVLGIVAVLALCFFCDIYYWAVDLFENRIPMLEGWGMEG